jgi:hypothetical protein
MVCINLIIKMKLTPEFNEMVTVGYSNLNLI